MMRPLRPAFALRCGAVLIALEASACLVQPVETEELEDQGDPLAPVVAPPPAPTLPTVVRGRPPTPDPWRVAPSGARGPTPDPWKPPDGTGDPTGESAGSGTTGGEASGAEASGRGTPGAP